MAKINHVALKVSDLEAATKFYENVYGFRQVKTGRSRGHVSRHMTDGYIDLALMVYDSEDDPEAKLVGPGPAIHHFGIEVEDTEAFIARIEANGGTILENEPRGPAPPGSRPRRHRSWKPSRGTRSNPARPTARSRRSSRSAATRRRPVR